MVEWVFEIIKVVLGTIVSTIIYSILGLLQMIFNFEIQRFFTLLIILVVVSYDLFFIAPDSHGIEMACINFFILMLPFIYLSQIGKKGVIN